MYIRSQTNYWELRILFEVQELAKICETAASLKPPIATVYTLSNNQKYGKHIHKKIKHVEPHLKKHNATCSVGKNMSPFDFTFFQQKERGETQLFEFTFFFEKAGRKTNVIFPISKLQKKVTGKSQFWKCKKKKNMLLANNNFWPCKKW